MNAPVETRHPQREDYFPTIKAFLPTAKGEEMEHRASLLLMRDRAMATKPVCSEYGWVILDLVEKIARDNAFRSLALNDLAEIRRQCIRLVSAASGLDMIFAPQLDLGGTGEGV